jgi:FYVE/RhoGEF/PH domain-containing protein 5/6
MTEEPKKESTRNRVIQELLGTERTYVQRLRATVSVFIQPLREGGVLTAAELEGQFGCLEEIAHIHYQFVEEMALAPYDSVGSLMNVFCRKLTLYQPYLLIFEGSLRKRAKLLLKNRRFNDLVEAAKINPACENLTLESFLVGPVQRIPRYKLLLDELRKHTPEDHPDYNNIVVACETIKEVATENNEAFHIREAEEVIYKIGMQFDPKIDLLGDNHTRRFLREDDFQKQCRKGLRPYRFWLFSDVLLYGVLNPSLRTYQLKRKLDLISTRITTGRLDSNSSSTSTSTSSTNMSSTSVSSLSLQLSHSLTDVCIVYPYRGVVFHCRH